MTTVPHHRSKRAVRPPSSASMAILISLPVLVSACASSTELSTAPDSRTLQTDADAAHRSSARFVEDRLRSEVAEWVGTPYRMGGASVQGIDCSAFVQRVYADLFDVGLPRATREQVNDGESVSRRDLRPGDLVFFRLPTGTRHVGIYLNEGEFAHASSSRGVTTSSLDETYWDRSYWTSRRVLPRSPVPEVAASRERRHESQKRESRRVRREAAVARENVTSVASRRDRIGW